METTGKRGEVAGDLFAVPVGGDMLLFSPLRQTAAYVNKSAFELVRRDLAAGAPPGGLSADLADLVSDLKGPFCFRPDFEDRPFKPKFLGFVPTRACNLSCAYCDFGADQEGLATMDLKLVEAALTWYADFLENSGHPIMEVHFFGGEPFCAREVVETAVHRTRALAARRGLKPHLEVSTNGVFDPDCAVFVGDYFDAVILSFDGFKPAHDRHRGSFEKVCRSATALAKSPTELCLRCCASSANIHELEKIGEWFCREFQPSAVDFETLVPNEKSKAAGLFPPDPYVFASHCHHALRKVRRAGVEAVYAAAEFQNPRTSFCPVGNDALIVSPDGRIGSCYLPRSKRLSSGIDLEVGRIEPSGEVRVDIGSVARLRRIAQDKPRCSGCFCKWTCAGGCHVNHAWNKASPRYDDFCIQTRLLTACAILDALGRQPVADALLCAKQAMEALALNVSDRVFPEISAGRHDQFER